MAAIPEKSRTSGGGWGGAAFRRARQTNSLREMHEAFCIGQGGHGYFDRRKTTSPLVYEKERR
ncbi:uncharacterized protein VDAG_00133 [Verticillium dahliae VdLs.17]|uniref:Uncharacterized protein n=1 Tax=Verticillium dahliae (strain VdLs.17 / ATCC MYA-4575 / FGSC 10137) TaxID=498257 RepID=G2WRF0_VERDV|nr:uncharacterized protein VDAG_00133 [Verticillium dahliae VdLs.17]EGY13451.1 hypothetical protein VDAG_00133 [Verticillium dahliae VdLs.17]